MKPDDRASVLQGVNRPVVFQQGLDITEHILGMLESAGPDRPASWSGRPDRAEPPIADRLVPQRPAGTIQR